MKEFTRTYFEEMRKNAETGKEISRGARQAFWAYQYTVDNGTDEFLVAELPWQNGLAEDFIKTLREAKVEEFITTDSSTALIRTLHELDKYGCKVAGLATINIKVWREIEELKGIKMVIA